MVFGIVGMAMVGWFSLQPYHNHTNPECLTKPSEGNGGLIVANDKGLELNKLTSSEVSKALRSGEPATLKDGGSLSLVITGKSTGKWLYKGRKAGSRTIIDLVCGYAPGTGLSAARAKRDEYKLLLRQGINPNENKKAAQAEARRQKEEAGKTFSVVAGEYFRSRQDLTGKTLQGDVGRIANHVAPFIGNIPVKAINRQNDLKPVIDALSDRKAYTQALRVAGLIERIFTYAVDAGYIQGTPADRLSRLVPKQGRGQKRHLPAMTEQQAVASMLRKLWEYMASGRSGPSMQYALALSCYLPVRNGNMIEARWEHIDMDAGIWTFPKTKNGKGYQMPLSRQMKEAFQHLAMLKISELTLSCDALLNLDELADEIQGRVFLLQYLLPAIMKDLPASECRAVNAVIEDTWKAVDAMRSVLKLDAEEVRNA
uniref:Uncharacterized protein n=1 Tax=uncultured prokaryote TaxID=198431 RepID=A0A0H5Q215_9ZZZZ|nr:hypothetical protein [uncultured prokaryote]